MNILGAMLREFRIRNKISQEALSFGLCSVSNLSRIENGGQIPCRKLVEGLFSRAGAPLPLFAQMDAKDFERFNLGDRMTAALAFGNYEIAGLLARYKECAPDMDRFEEQHYELCLAIYEAAHGADLQAVISRLSGALSLTLPPGPGTFSRKNLLLTRTELLLLNNIAVYQYDAGLHEDALRRMYFLKDYFETRTMDEQEKAKNYPVILLNASNWEGLAEHYEAALSLAEQGLDIAIRYGKLFLFPRFLFNKGYCLSKMHREAEGRHFLGRAFSYWDDMKKHDHAVQMARQVNAIFGYGFPEE